LKGEFYARSQGAITRRPQKREIRDFTPGGTSGETGKTRRRSKAARTERKVVSYIPTTLQRKKELEKDLVAPSTLSKI